MNFLRLFSLALVLVLGLSGCGSKIRGGQAPSLGGNGEGIGGGGDLLGKLETAVAAAEKVLGSPDARHICRVSPACSGADAEVRELCAEAASLSEPQAISACEAFVSEQASRWVYNFQKDESGRRATRFEVTEQTLRLPGGEVVVARTGLRPNELIRVNESLGREMGSLQRIQLVVHEGAHQITGLEDGSSWASGVLTRDFFQMMGAAVALATLSEQTAATAPASAEAKFAAALLKDAAGWNPPTESEVSRVVQRMAGYTGTPWQVRNQAILSVRASTEGRTKQIHELYRSFLQRDADPAGLSLRLQQLGQGVTYVSMAAELVGSPEYFSKFTDGSARGFVLNAYRDLLKVSLTNLDSEGEGFVSRLQNGSASRRQIALDLVAAHGAEFWKAFVQSWHQQYLGFQTSFPSGTVGKECLDLLLAGTSPEIAFARLVAGDTYWDRVTQ